MHPDLQALQDQKLLMHTYIKLILDESLLLHPDIQENWSFPRKYLRFNIFLIPFISNGNSFYGFIHCSNISRICTTWSIKKYLSFNILFIMFIRNGNSFYGFIRCYNIFRSCSKINNWFLKSFFRNNSRCNLFNHFTHCYIFFLYYFCNNYCLCLALCNPWCVNFVIIIKNIFQLTDYDPSFE